MALLIGLFVGGTVVMDKTMTVHDEDVAPNSRLEVELAISTRGGAESDEASIAQALVYACEVEIRARVEPDSIHRVGDGRYRFMLHPSLDTDDRTQLKGCLQDLRLDGALGNVVWMAEP